MAYLLSITNVVKLTAFAVLALIYMNFGWPINK